MKKILFFVAIVSFTSFGLVSCSEDDPVMETPTANPNPNVGKQLKLVPNATFIKLGNKVTFKAMSGSNEVIDATFYVNGEPIKGKEYQLLSEDKSPKPIIGEVKAHTRRAGYEDSEVVTIQFAQQPY